MATHFAKKFAEKFTGTHARTALIVGMLGLAFGTASPSAHGQDLSTQPPRARQLLKNAREFYAKGEYEAAARAYQQVALAKESLTPTEQQDLAAQIKQNNTALGARGDGIKLLEQAEKALANGKDTDAEGYLRLAQANQFLSSSDKQRLGAMTQALGKLRSAQNELDGKADGAALLSRARDAFKRGDLESAEALARQAERSRSFMSGLVFWGDSPARVLDDVRAARSKLPKSDPNGPAMVKRPAEMTFPGTAAPPPGVAAEPEKTTVTNYPPGDRTKAKSQARQLVLDGYKALEANDVEGATKLAQQAKDLRPDLEWWEPNPEKLFNDIQRRATTNQVAAGGTDARTILRQARSFYLQQRFDDAEKLAAQADAIPGNRWGLFEDSPRKLRDEIVRARSQMDQEKAARLTADARKLLRQNNVAEAKALALQAKQLGGTTSRFWTWGDTPDAVLAEVARLEKSNPLPPAVASMPMGQPNVGPPPFPPAPQPKNTVAGIPLPPPAPDIAQAGNIVPPPPGYTLESALLKKQAKARAIALLIEARNLEKQGHLVEARIKATDAQQVFSSWEANEESPSLVLRDLDTRAGARIKGLLDQATDTVLKNPTDPSRFQKADSYLFSAKQLAEAFRQDAAPIHQKVQWLHQMASQSPISPMAGKEIPGMAAIKPASYEEPNVPRQPLGEGAEKLQAARLELKAGNTPLARKLAEEAFYLPGMNDEATKVLRSIDAEEHAQTMLAAQRNYEAGLDAFRNKDYRKAATIFTSIDARLLKAEHARRIGEVMETKEMQLSMGALAGPKSKQDAHDPAVTQASTSPVGPGKASISDIDDPHLSMVRRMQEVQFGKYRDLKLTAERKAMDLEKSGKLDLAIETLHDYLAEVRGSGMEQDIISRLTPSVENRIQKLRTTLAQKEIEKQQRAATGQNYNEAEHVAKKTKLQEKVADLVNRGSAKAKEGKYDEALVLGRQAQELDPDNGAARALIFVANQNDLLKKEKAAKDRMADYFLDALDNDAKNLVTGPNAVKGDKEYMAKLNLRRDTSVQILLSKSPKEMVIERKLSAPITLNVQDQPLYRVLQDLQILSGVNIVPDKGALQREGISLEQPLSLNVENISMKSALNLLLKQVRLTYVIRNEVIEITTESESRGKQRMVTYSVADLVVPVDDHPTSTTQSFEEALKRHIQGTSGGVSTTAPTPHTGPFALQNGTPVSSNGTGQGYQPSGGPSASNWQTSKSTNHTIEHLIINLITNTISPDTWESSGGQGRIQYFPLGHALVVSQIQEVQEEVQALLNALRRLQDIQVSIEMRIVSVSEQFFERIGMDFDINIRTPHYRQENQLLTGSYAPFNQVNRNLGVNGLVTGLTPAGTLTPDLNVPIRPSSFDFSIPPFGGYPGTLGADGGLSLGLAFLSDIQVFMFLEAAQGDRRTHIMQAPKLTVFNGQTANINVQDQMFFLTGVSVVQAGSQTFFLPQNQPFPIGVGMQVTPVVSADRRFVRLNLIPQLTNLVSPNIPLIPVQIPVPQLFDYQNGTGAISGQPVIFQMFFQQPAFTTINVQTTVNVPDGGTVLLGGLKTLAEGRNEFGPPILSKIPYLSRLFRNTAFGREAQSIMIMVTPRIIINEEIEQEILGQVTPIPRDGGLPIAPGGR